MILSLSDRKPAAARNHLRPVVGLAVVLLGLATTGLQAQLPTVGTVVAGSATITTAPNTMTVTAGNNSVLRWGSFDVGTGQTVQFVQPGSDARVLNWIGGLPPPPLRRPPPAHRQGFLLQPAGRHIRQLSV